jgi:hypothetical protein
MSTQLECEKLALRAIQQFRHQQYHESRVTLALIDSRWRDGSLVMSKRAIHALIKLSKAAESRAKRMGPIQFQALRIANRKV